MKELLLVLLCQFFFFDSVESSFGVHHQDISDSLLASPLPAAPFLTSVCCLTGHSNRYLLEWVLYHYLVGIEHFYIYDNNPPNASAQPVLRELIDLRLVELIPWYTTVDGRPLTQGAMIHDCIKTRARDQTRWVGIWDDDEFLRVEAAQLPQRLDPQSSRRRMTSPLRRIFKKALHTNCSGFHLDRIEFGTGSGVAQTSFPSVEGDSSKESR